MADFFAAGLVSSSLALHYGCIAGVNFPNCPFNIAVQFAGSKSSDFLAVENEYAPFGVDIGPVHGRGRDRVQRRGRDAAAVWRVVQDGVGPGHP